MSSFIYTHNIGDLKIRLEELHRTFPGRQLLLNLGDQKYHSSSIPAFIQFALKNRDAEWHFDQARFRMTLVQLSPNAKLLADIKLAEVNREVYALLLKGQRGQTVRWTDPITGQHYSFPMNEDGVSMIYIGESKVGSGKKGDHRGATERIRQHGVWTRKYVREGESSDKAYPLYRFLSEVDPSLIEWNVIDTKGELSENEWMDVCRESGYDLLNVIKGSITSNLKD
jgi:hypothetical protein